MYVHMCVRFSTSSWTGNHTNNRKWQVVYWPHTLNKSVHNRPHRIANKLCINTKNSLKLCHITIFSMLFYSTFDHHSNYAMRMGEGSKAERHMESKNCFNINVPDVELWTSNCIEKKLLSQTLLILLNSIVFLWVSKIHYN